MTYQNKAELFRIYLEGKINIEANTRKRAFDELLEQDFASEEWEDVSQRIDRHTLKIMVMKQIQHRFNEIFKEDKQ